MATRLIFVPITVEADPDNDRWHARLPYSDPDGANGAVGQDRSDSVRNLYAVMDENVVLVEERGEQNHIWLRPQSGTTVMVESL